MLLRSLVLVGSLVGCGLALPSDQIPLIGETRSVENQAQRVGKVQSKGLKGKFLHITDFHPDRFYEPYTSTAEGCACHRGKGPAGLYGAETSDCDSPTSLVNATFQWIDDNLKDEIDFVIWTGDSARHDSDEKIPRTEKEVLGLNAMLVDKFVEVFGKEDSKMDTGSTNDMIVPIVPTFGNNDILPHNIMYPGPNYWTRHFSKVWEKFIPEEQRHGFERGGWFFVEAIPNQLAVFSLNTLYFFDSNSAVDGCAHKSEPGYEQFEWLRIQLQFLRERGMKAILTGHVPPARTESKQSWDETCWQKYALWMQQYRDVVVGSVYGHMNIDHFMIQDFKDIKKKTRKGRNIHRGRNFRSALSDDTLTAQTKSEYLSELQTDWSQIPDPPKSKKKSKDCEGFFCDLVDYVNELKVEWSQLPKPPEAQSESTSYIGGVNTVLNAFRKILKKHGKSDEEKYFNKIGGQWGERYALSFVSPSVVPNYFPTLRVVEYNISGVEAKASDTRKLSILDMDEMGTGVANDNQESSAKKGKKKKKHHKKKPKFIVPSPPSDTASPGPAYSPQAFTLLGYKQYFANLTEINNDFLGDYGDYVSATANDELNEQKWKEGKHSGKHPKSDRPKKHHAKFKYEIEYDSQNDSIYRLPDMTMRSYLDLARTIGKFKSSPSFETCEQQHPKMESSPSINEQDINDDHQLPKLTHRKQYNGKSRHDKKNKKKKGKKKEKSDEQQRINETWFTFVKRAFVEAVDDEDLKEEFGLV